ncbi:TPA: hypothetical protein ACHWKK_003278 [Providencia stuartii]|uniref:Uncharacterized protein n=5 Tax=Morganellaceae TaxID=1903414 RepID=A0AAJ1N4Q7_PROST|nr:MULTISPECIES: hypothetical protein [Providencia]AFH95178.1 hypothetical protein S70_16825 [Providencia stuartii MRSN 2154]MDE8771895.1 hypothetical protein [Providencia thailandensis]
MNITKLPIDKKFQANGELSKRLLELIHEYDGEISLAEAIGVIEIVKLTLIGEQESQQ